LKVGVVSGGRYEARVRELVAGFPWLTAIAEPLLSVRRVMRQQLAVLHKMLHSQVDRDDQPIAKPNQELDVRQTPNEPGDASSELGPEKIDERLFMPDRREVAEVSIPERCSRCLRSQPAEASADNYDP
jgi:hypothetical protein